MHLLWYGCYTIITPSTSLAYADLRQDGNSVRKLLTQVGLIHWYTNEYHGQAHLVDGVTSFMFPVHENGI
jgi:hypothetical protein